MARAAEDGDCWEAYYEVVSGRPPRELYRQALRRFSEPGFAIDLGCGSGVETIDLLQRGWRVLAVDKQALAGEQILERVPRDAGAEVDVRAVAFEELELPPADFVWAGLSLPFCEPRSFDALWSRIVAALRPGARFAGDLFGPRHAWVASGKLAVHTRAQVEDLAGSLELEYIQESEGEVPTALNGIQHWHMFSLCLRKPDAGSREASPTR